MRSKAKYGVMVIATAGALGLAEVAGAAPVTYSFGNITGNNATNAGTAGQYSVTVSDAGAGLVKFRFANAGPSASSIAQIYFYDGALIGAVVDIVGSSAGVDFTVSPGGGPLPGANTVPLPFQSVQFEATADPPPASNGINPGEWLEITFDLADGKTFDHVIASMNSGLDAGSEGFDEGVDLVIGIHVQAFAGGGSESFITIPLPAPFVMGLAGLGLVGLGGLRRRFVSRKA